MRMLSPETTARKVPDGTPYSADVLKSSSTWKLQKENQIRRSLFEQKEEKGRIEEKKEERPKYDGLGTSG
ncbi:hypothetical protein BPAE_0014g00820 [Botrytis paeoniae]|uniref:Uncharacterized protein n=1 Tax=Botrytis paeoniae TaxID=278948 RepID=A0A4Z1G278_9HELO|nr:hypothetical protein BPAE_0014g00820 [Botrytis paeoniae]